MGCCSSAACCRCSTRLQNVLSPSPRCIEQAFCSGVEGRSNLTAAAVRVSMILAPLHVVCAGTNDILEHTALRGPFRSPVSQGRNPKFLFRTFGRGVTEQKNRSASSRFLGNMSWFLRSQPVAKARRPTHGTYRFLPHPATELRSGFHGPDLPDVRGDNHGLDSLPASPLRHRSHLLPWPCRRRALVAVSSLLQPRRLGH